MFAPEVPKADLTLFYQYRDEHGKWRQAVSPVVVSKQQHQKFRTSPSGKVYAAHQKLAHYLFYELSLNGSVEQESTIGEEEPVTGLFMDASALDLPIVTSAQQFMDHYIPEDAELVRLSLLVREVQVGSAVKESWTLYRLPAYEKGGRD